MEDELSSLFDDENEFRAYEAFCAAEERGPEPFDLDRPALVCRWRMAGKRVPLLNRHIRALSRRTVQGAPLPRNLISWVKQHIEWSLAEGDYDERDGVLMLVVDVNGNAAMSVGPYAPLADVSAAGLCGRAGLAAVEAAETGVAPEALCQVDGDRLTVFQGEGALTQGALTLIEQLADTRGLAWDRAGLPRGVMATGDTAPGAAAPVSSLDSVVVGGGSLFLVSDEHGIVPAEGADDPFISLCIAGYKKIFDKTR